MPSGVYDTIYLEKPSVLGQDLYVYINRDPEPIANFRYTKVVKTSKFNRLLFKWDSATDTEVEIVIGNPENFTPVSQNIGSQEVGIVSDSVGLAKETTLSAIKSKTDKLTFHEDGSLYVDVLGIEKETEIDEIDTGSVSSPQTALTPTSGKKIDVRNVYLSSDSNSGEVEARFPTSGKLLAKLYCAVQKAVTLQDIHVVGATDESIEISWNGLSTGAKIFYAIRYKEVS